MTELPRRPAAFRVDDPRVVIAEPQVSLPDAADQALAVADTAIADAISTRSRRLRWGTLFWSACSGLVLLALGLAVTSFVEELYARAPWLGAVGLILAVVAGLALLALVLREIVGLVRLGTIEALRSRALATIESDDRDQGRALVADLLALTRRMPRLARARSRLEAHLPDIIDGRDRVRLAERELMEPLDAEARRLIVAAAKRVSVVTAVSPRAAVDMLFVLINALALIRKLAVLYGGRPGTLGVLRLFRQVVSHLAMTGGVAVTDSLLQQIIGHGVAARLSARLGEGMLNGILTARLGILAIDVTRPLPFSELPRPALNDLVGILLRPNGREAEDLRGPELRPPEK
jgi:putative membrane protein